MIVIIIIVWLLVTDYYCVALEPIALTLVDQLASSHTYSDLPVAASGLLEVKVCTITIQLNLLLILILCE